MSVKPIPLEVNDGVVYTASKAKNSLSWREVNLVRWTNGKMDPIRGWSRYNYAAPAAIVRTIHRWKDQSGVTWIAYLCDGFLYVEYDGDLFDISPTPALEAFSVDFAAGGYGDDVYGEGDYGTPRPAAPGRQEIGPAFKLDNWGEDLLIMSSADGRLLRWTPAFPPAACEVVPNAPVNNYTFAVTPERFVQLFGAGGDFNRVEWCDQEDIEDWAPGLTSKAGGYGVEPAAPCVGALNVGEMGTLFFTTRKAYVTRYIGEPYIYDNPDEVGEGMPPISPQVLSRTVSGATWLSRSGFWNFNGSAVSPVVCPIWEWIEAEINWQNARFIACSVDLPERSEYWVFFPVGDDQFNSRVAILNYKEGWWSMGKLARTASFSSDFISNPIMADRFTVYEHENSDQYPDITELPWAESFELNFEGGGVLTKLLQIFPEVEGDPDTIRFSIAYRTRRTPDNEQFTPQRSLQQNTGAVEFLAQGVVGRDFRLRVDSDEASVLRWGLGPVLVSAVPVGIKP